MQEITKIVLTHSKPGALPNKLSHTIRVIMQIKNAICTLWFRSSDFFGGSLVSDCITYHNGMHHDE